jgi:hypothetical protein
MTTTEDHPMILGLTSQHRDALKWACEFAADDPDAARRFINVVVPGVPESIRLPEDEPRNEALRLLLIPSASAVIVRSLLDGCGVRAVDLYETPTAEHDVDLWHVNAGLCFQFSETRTETFPVLCIPMVNVPALILVLLTCKTREEVLAVMQGAS